MSASSTVLIFVRSLIFNVLFYVWLVVLMIVALPSLALSRRAALGVARFWAHGSIWLLRVVCRTRLEVHGRENIPAGPLIVASKHQSMWETFALVCFFDEPLYILKRELEWIPLFGWYLKKTGMIGVNRTAGGRSLRYMLRRARDEVQRGRQLIIFPEGTRTPVDAPARYKPGIGQIYASCGVQCLPVALNSGLFWPRRTFLRYPGTLVIEFLDPVPPGLPRDEFVARIGTVIEDATRRIVETSRREQAELFDRAPGVTTKT